MASSARIDRVLSGHASYDDLDARAQATVRRAWEERLAEDIAHLDVTEHLRAAGRPWAEADDEGNVIWRDPPPATAS